MPDDDALKHYPLSGLRRATAVATLMNDGDPEALLDYLDGLSTFELRITCSALASSWLRVLHDNDVEDVAGWLRNNALANEGLLS